MFDSDFITNPYRTYTQLRTAAPLLWADKFRSGAWIVTRYADVLAGLHDSRLSSQRSHTLTAALPSEVQSEFSTFNQIFSKWMLFLDPPEHSRLRKLLNKEFTPNMIQRMPGIPGEHQRDFQVWSDDLANFFGVSSATVDTARRAQNSLVNLTEYFRALLPARRENKGDDLVSLLLRVEEEGEVLSGDELLAQCTLLLVAGHETTPKKDKPSFSS